MAVSIKTPQEIEKMRVAGRLTAEVLEFVEPHVKPGITTNELDRLCHDYITRVQRAVAAPLNYHGFPKSICTSVNHCVCHGIPGDKRLKARDIVNIDVTVIKDGFHGDTSKMFALDGASVLAKRLTRMSHRAMWVGIEQVRPGVRLSRVGRAIERFAHAQRCSVVQEYCGHGIGREFHEEPQVLHYGGTSPAQDLVLRPGMIFTIEPMLNAGKRHVKLLPDGWTVVTKDRSLSAQWEHTVLVTDSGYEILTDRDAV